MKKNDLQFTNIRFIKSINILFLKNLDLHSCVVIIFFKLYSTCSGWHVEYCHSITIPTDVMFYPWMWNCRSLSEITCSVTRYCKHLSVCQDCSCVMIDWHIFSAHWWHKFTAAEVEGILHTESQRANVIYSLFFTSSFNFMHCQQGLSLCESEILNNSIIFFSPRQRKSLTTGPTVCQELPVYQWKSKSIWSDVRMTLVSKFEYQVNISRKGPNKLVQFNSFLVLFHFNLNVIFEWSCLLLCLPWEDRIIMKSLALGHL